MLWFFLILVVVFWLLPYWYRGHLYAETMREPRDMEWELAESDAEHISVGRKNADDEAEPRTHVCGTSPPGQAPGHAITHLTPAACGRTIPPC